ncbi:MAG: type I restriction enzyme HsdR N-terminal domain-containing protein [Tannerellaceae bacterium]|jgi:hypothetical protein|nr:type I restriction enzyme HsdR N-terminal domain-containing protein [Tannerellaceae bacterium]
MDFKDVIKQLSERVEKLKDNLQTEEATKNALIMPFLQAMGYDVFNPLEVVPEFTCDIGTKKGEKIDYAILKEGAPIMLIECKHWQQDLTLHDNQLLRYFNVSNAKFGLLTNGIIYRFYTDLVTPNKMDEKPFLEIDLTDLRNNQVDELKKFHKTYFDIDNILSSASELKYTSELKAILIKEFANPSPEFVKLLAKQVYDGLITAKILDQFTLLVRKSIANHINDIISERLKTALKTDESDDAQQDAEGSEKEDKIITTEEEIEAYFIVKSILRSKIQSERITYRDAQSYFSVLIDDNNRKLICRLYLNSSTNKQIVFVGDNKKEIKYKIQSLDGIYSFSEQLLNIVEKYI